MGYLSNFMIYAFAMIGVIVIALLVYKHTTSGGSFGHKSKYLKIIDSMSLGQRKNLYIVSTGKEQFLISSDVDKTTLLSKIENVEDSLGLNVKRVQEEKTANNLNYTDKSIAITSSILDKIRR